MSGFVTYSPVLPLTADIVSADMAACASPFAADGDMSFDVPEDSEAQWATWDAGDFVSCGTRAYDVVMPLRTKGEGPKRNVFSKAPGTLALASSSSSSSSSDEPLTGALDWVGDHPVQSAAGAVGLVLGVVALLNAKRIARAVRQGLVGTVREHVQLAIAVRKFRELSKEKLPLLPDEHALILMLLEKGFSSDIISLFLRDSNSLQSLFHIFGEAVLVYGRGKYDPLKFIQAHQVASFEWGFGFAPLGILKRHRSSLIPEFPAGFAASLEDRLRSWERGMKKAASAKLPQRVELRDDRACKDFVRQQLTPFAHLLDLDDFAIRKSGVNNKRQALVAVRGRDDLVLNIWLDSSTYKLTEELFSISLFSRWLRNDGNGLKPVHTTEWRLALKDEAALSAAALSIGAQTGQDDSDRLFAFEVAYLIEQALERGYLAAEGECGMHLFENGRVVGSIPSNPFGTFNFSWSLKSSRLARLFPACYTEDSIVLDFVRSTIDLMCRSDEKKIPATWKKGRYVWRVGDWFMLPPEIQEKVLEQLEAATPAEWRQTHSLREMWLTLVRENEATAKLVLSQGIDRNAGPEDPSSDK